MPYPYSKGGVTSITWGDITGSLSAQTDLYDALVNAGYSTGDSFTDDTYWSSSSTTPPTPPGGGGSTFEASWSGTQWAKTGLETDTIAPLILVPIGSWATGYRPTTMTVTLNSGSDEGVGGDLDGGGFQVIRVYDDDGSISSSIPVNFTSWNQDIEVEVPLTFDTADITAVRIMSTLKNDGPYVKSIVFTGA